MPPVADNNCANGWICVRKCMGWAEHNPLQIPLSPLLSIPVGVSVRACVYHTSELAYVWVSVRSFVRVRVCA